MKKILNYQIIAASAIILFAACKKNDTSAAATTVDITVADGRTSYAASNATVYLYDSMTAVNGNTPKYTQVTDQNNEAKITVDYISQYYVVVVKSTAKNYFSGLIPVGVFQSQADITDSPIQTPAGVVGGVKYKDLNGDGIINNLDKTDAPTISLTKSINNTQTVTVY